MKSQTQKSNQGVLVSQSEIESFFPYIYFLPFIQVQAVLWRQHSKQRSPDCPLPSHFLQGDTESSPGQLRDKVSGHGSALRPPPGVIYTKHLPREASRPVA